MVPKAALATMMQTPRPPCSAPHRPAPGERRGFRRPRASRGPVACHVRAGLGSVGLGWHPASRRPVTRAARPPALGRRARCRRPVRPRMPVRPPAPRPSQPGSRPRGPRPWRPRPAGRTPGDTPPRAAVRPESPHRRDDPCPSPAAAARPRRLRAGRTLAPPRVPPQCRLALPGAPGGGPERGRAAWLQARRRTACSGVVRAVVSRSYVLRMLAVAPWYRGREGRLRRTITIQSGTAEERCHG